MKIAGFIVCLFISLNVTAQRAYFDGRAIDTFEISSAVGYYHFDSLHTSTSIVNRYIIFFDTNCKKYSYMYIKGHDTMINKLEKEVEQRDTIAFENFKSVSYLDNVCSALSIQYKPLTISSVGITKRQLRRYITRKRIRHLTQSYKRPYSDSAVNAILYECSNMNNLEYYINSFRTDTTGVLLGVTDFTENIHLYISSGHRQSSCWATYPNKCMQPWYCVLDTSVDHVQTTFNFDINKWLALVLPSDFKLRETIDKNAILYYYLKSRILGHDDL